MRQRTRHLCVLTGAVPARVEVADTSAQGGGDGVAGLPVTLGDAVVHGVHLLHKVLVELWRTERERDVTEGERRRLVVCVRSHGVGGGGGS